MSRSGSKASTRPESRSQVPQRPAFKSTRLTTTYYFVVQAGFSYAACLHGGNRCQESADSIDLTDRATDGALDQVDEMHRASPREMLFVPLQRLAIGGGDLATLGTAEHVQR